MDDATIEKVYHFLYGHATAFGSLANGIYAIQITMTMTQARKELGITKQVMEAALDALKISGVVKYRDGFYFKLQGHYDASYRYSKPADPEEIDPEEENVQRGNHSQKSLEHDELEKILIRIANNEIERIKRELEGQPPEVIEKEIKLRVNPMIDKLITGHRKFSFVNNIQPKL